MARRQKLELGDVAIDSSVSLITTEDRGYTVAVELDVTLPDVGDADQAKEIVTAAHRVCPYSNATRGNIDVELMRQRPAGLGQQPDPLGALHRLGAVARLELAVDRARVLLDRVRREVQLLGDLLVGRARRRSGRAPRARARRAVGAGWSAWAEHLMPSATIRTAARPRARPSPWRRTPKRPPRARRRARSARRRRSAAPASTGRRARISSQTSAPDSRPRNRSTSATSGWRCGERERLGAGARGQAALHPRLLAQQHAEAPVHDVVVVDDEHPQLAVAARPGGCGDGAHTRASASGTTAGRAKPSPARQIHHAAVLEGLEAPGADPCPRPARRRDPVVADLQAERVVVAGAHHLNHRGAGVFGDVAQRLGQHGLGQRLDPVGTATSSGQMTCTFGPGACTSRATSAASVVPVSVETGASGRSSALRRWRAESPRGDQDHQTRRGRLSRACSTASIRAARACQWGASPSRAPP